MKGDAFLLSLAEQKLILRLRSLPPGSHLCTVTTGPGRRPVAVTVWSGKGCKMERLEDDGV